MRLTIEITVESVEEYLQVLAVLDQAEEDGELDCEVGLKPDLGSLSVLADVIAGAGC